MASKKSYEDEKGNKYGAWKLYRKCVKKNGTVKWVQLGTKGEKTCFNEKNDGKLENQWKLSRSLKKPGQSQFTAGDKRSGIIIKSEELANKLLSNAKYNETIEQYKNRLKNLKKTKTKAKTPTKTKTKAKTPTKTKTKSKTPTKTKTQTKSKTPTKTKTQTKSKTLTKTKTQTRSKTPTKSKTQTEKINIDFTPVSKLSQLEPEDELTVDDIKENEKITPMEKISMNFKPISKLDKLKKDELTVDDIEDIEDNEIKEDELTIDDIGEEVTEDDIGDEKLDFKTNIQLDPITNKLTVRSKDNLIKKQISDKLEKKIEKRINEDEINEDFNVDLNVEKSIEERDDDMEYDNEYVLSNMLYPSLEDKNFNKKLSIRKEFLDIALTEKEKKDLPNKYKNIEEESNKLCDFNRDFELEPHQKFVKNFLSFQTPYNSLLLYHGLGTGKTCSSIQISEEFRSYLKQLGINKKILIIASPVVQDNYKLQLFDDRKLKKVNGEWNINSCLNNKFLKEVNPTSTQNISKKRLVLQIKKLISKWYRFMGYTEFSNYIDNISKKTSLDLDGNIDDQKMIEAIKKEFSNTLIVIDEVHNIRTGTSNKVKPSSERFLNLIKYSQNTKLLFLTATPMYNDYKEIIWLINLMNLNDNRYAIKNSDIFDMNGNFKIDSEGNEIGKELLVDKTRGYVSYVRGNSVFNFPFSIYPMDSNDENSLLYKSRTDTWQYPKYQINGIEIENEDKISYLDVYLVNLNGSYQNKIYNNLINKYKEEGIIEKDKGFGYTTLDGPLQLLDMSYPLDEEVNDYNEYYGKAGLLRIMDKDKKKYDYKEETLEKYGRIFSLDKIGEYSRKIETILNHVKKSTGIVMIYSQYIQGGCIPLALALEELGLSRYDNNKSLLKTKSKNPHLFKNEKGDNFKGKYIMITGDPILSPNNEAELKVCTNRNNTYGEYVKVVIISRAGSEGLDFKNIRQIHLMEPWYNLNRTNQTIGRTVRNLSHCQLPFNERNVEIFLYASELLNKDEESLDLYMYRYAEKKSIQISQVLSVLKKNAVDCVINIDRMKQYENTDIKLKLSSGKVLDNYNIKFKDYSMICDFGECEYSCDFNIDKSKESNISYDEYFITMNIDIIMKKIKNIFNKIGYVFHKRELFKLINNVKVYSKEEIYSALDILINDNNEFLRDTLDRSGRLINIGNYYLFQPLDIDNKNISLYERTSPIPFKRKLINFDVPNQFYLKVKTNIKLLSKYKDYIKDIEEFKSSNKDIQSFNYAITYMLNNFDINKKLLMKYFINYFIEKETIENKLVLLNNIDNDNDDVKEYVKSYFDNYKLKENVYMLPNNKLKNNYGVYVKTNEKYDLELDNIYINEIKRKYLIREWKNKLLSNTRHVGFFDKHGKNNKIVFKLKLLGSKKGERGSQCGLGQTKNSMYDTTKKLIKLLNQNLNKNVNFTGKMSDSMDKRYENVSRTMPVKYTCSIIYLMLKYLDDNVDGEKYFFNLLENYLYNVTTLNYKMKDNKFLK